MEHFVKEYLNEQGIKTVEGLAEHIIELKRNTVVPKIVFDLVDVLVNKKDCLLNFFVAEKLKKEVFEKIGIKREDKYCQKSQSFFSENNKKPTNSTNTLGYDPSKFVMLTLDREVQDRSVKSVEKSRWQVFTEFSNSGNFQKLEEFEKNATNKVRQEKVKTVLDDMLGEQGVKETAYKETEGKLFYELDWSFITQMAERMASSKKEGKYELFNWKRPMTQKVFEDLKQATMRHLLEVMGGKYEDDGRELGHLEAISTNMMMINYQLKNVK